MTASLFDYTEEEFEELFNDVVDEIIKISSELKYKLLLFKHKPEVNELLSEIVRNFHTIKGTSSIVGLMDIAKISAKLELQAKGLLKDTGKINEDIVSELIEGNDEITANICKKQCVYK
ncbi:MAG: Hpt domain-containing protein [bacterium]